MGIEKELSILEGGVILSPKVRKFIRMYDGDIVNSMINAGFTGDFKTLQANGKLILTQPAVIAAIKELAELKASEVSLIAKKDEVLYFLSNTMRNEDPNHVKSVKDGIVQEFENIPIANRLKAAELLGKKDGLFSERLELAGSVSIMDVVRKAHEDEDDDLDAIEAEYTRVQENKKQISNEASYSDPFTRAEDLV